MNAIDFYNKLAESLPTSDAQDRKEWAAFIIESKIDLKYLSNLLRDDKKVASRFLWLLGDVAGQDHRKLYDELPFLFALRDEIDLPSFKTSFATYWAVCGIPPENEAEAIELLFEWIQSSKVNVTTKSRSISALLNLTKKYPELKNELKLCLDDQLDQHTKSFKKKVEKTIEKLG